VCACAVDIIDTLDQTRRFKLAPSSQVAVLSGNTTYIGHPQIPARIKLGLCMLTGQKCAASQLRDPRQNIGLFFIALYISPLSLCHIFRADITPNSSDNISATPGSGGGFFFCLFPSLSLSLSHTLSP
jgi:hypothetical protein